MEKEELCTCEMGTMANQKAVGKPEQKAQIWNINQKVKIQVQSSVSTEENNTCSRNSWSGTLDSICWAKEDSPALVADGQHNGWVPKSQVLCSLSL